jgi:hypothetical protein
VWFINQSLLFFCRKLRIILSNGNPLFSYEKKINLKIQCRFLLYFKVLNSLIRSVAIGWWTLLFLIWETLVQIWSLTQTTQSEIYRDTPQFLQAFPLQSQVVSHPIIFHIYEKGKHNKLLFQVNEIRLRRNGKIKLWRKRPSTYRKSGFWSQPNTNQK